MISPAEINKAYGNIDLYLFDQILKGRFENRSKLLDCGCGEGRNLNYFTSSGFQVYGIDNYSEAIKMAAMVHKEKALFIESAIEDKPFPLATFDIILCINVLHHAKGAEHFTKIFDAMIDMAAINGIVFIRTLLADHNDSFSDGLFRILEKNFFQAINRRGIKWLEPLKKEVMNDGNQLCVAVLSR